MPDHLWLWMLLLLLLGASGLVSGSETALFSLSRHDLYQLGRSPRRLRRMAAGLMHHPRRVLLTILIANTLVNVLIFAISYVSFGGEGGERSALWASLGSVGSLVAVIVFGEVVPKGVAMGGARQLAPLAAPLVSGLSYVLTPLRILLDGMIVEPLTRLLAPARSEPSLITTQELRLLVDVSQRRGVIDDDESALLQEVLELGQRKVRDAMVPRVDLKAFDIDGEPADLRRFMQEHRLKKVPVYTGDIDHIEGLIYAKNLFLHEHEDLRRLLRPVRYVPEQMRLDQLLEHFRHTKTQIAIVVDEFGGTAGLVTLEDALESVVGEIEPPERAPSVPSVEQIDDRTFLVAGGLSVREWADAFGRRLRDQSVATLAGLVLAELGRVPHPGDAVRIGNVQLTVDQMRGRRIERLKVELIDVSSAPGQSAT
ncbi:MAG TPA: hemolysin family protein [Phycisphaerae bacterium]|nr:hemolysin family protein [Phycisphaerae bacterium]